eukprot:TRINITY_DN12838_c0_g1_i1.p1 TRINITY_DN12838_c0_g1~~TRINITY_DN12838_c0_g1_i1.p1  ORF type:complete len:459 (-),score=59.73 TRINITY_DN12838_c0_g1_i1:241-1617(-)
MAFRFSTRSFQSSCRAIGTSKSLASVRRTPVPSRAFTPSRLAPLHDDGFDVNRHERPEFFSVNRKNTQGQAPHRRVQQQLFLQANERYNMPVPLVDEPPDRSAEFTFIAYCNCQQIDCETAFDLLPKMFPAPWAPYGVDAGSWPGFVVHLRKPVYFPVGQRETKTGKGTTSREDHPVPCIDMGFLSVRPLPDDDPTIPTETLAFFKIGCYVFWHHTPEASPLRSAVSEAKVRGAYEYSRLIKPLLHRWHVPPHQLADIYGPWLADQGIAFDPNVRNATAAIPSRVVLEMRLDLSRVIACRVKLYAMRVWLLEADERVQQFVRMGARDGAVYMTSRMLVYKVQSIIDLVSCELDFVESMMAPGPTAYVGNVVHPTPRFDDAVRSLGVRDLLTELRLQLGSMRQVMDHVQRDLDRQVYDRTYVMVFILWLATVIGLVMTSYAKSLRKYMSSDVMDDRAPE